MHPKDKEVGQRFMGGAPFVRSFLGWYSRRQLPPACWSKLWDKRKCRALTDKLESAGWSLRRPASTHFSLSFPTGETKEVDQMPLWFFAGASDSNPMFLAVFAYSARGHTTSGL